MPRKGQRGEDRVANSLRRRGFSVEQSPGSRGPADLKGNRGDRRWFVQVKSSSTGSPAWPNPQELGRLKSAASRADATPVVAQVTPRGITYKSGRNQRHLKP